MRIRRTFRLWCGSLALLRHCRLARGIGGSARRWCRTPTIKAAAKLIARVAHVSDPAENHAQLETKLCAPAVENPCAVALLNGDLVLRLLMDVTLKRLRSFLRWTLEGVSQG